MNTSKKILMIDDDVDLIQTLSIILNGAGYEVISANTGPDGVALAKSSTPDLIILDVMMTTIDEGFETARALRAEEQLCRIPVLMLSGVDKEFNFDFGIQAGSDYLPVNQFINKPIAPQALLDAVQELLN